MEQDLRYPIGRFDFSVESLSASERLIRIDAIAAFPRQLISAIQSSSDAQLDTPYRPDGWTVRQVIHHVADSHMNGYVRMKLALAEDVPTIKPYNQDAWAKLPDSQGPVTMSLQILEGLHRRWAVLMRSLSGDDFARRLHHPEEGTLSLDTTLALYAWHGNHHLAHITSLSQRLGW